MRIKRTLFAAIVFTVLFGSQAVPAPRAQTGQASDSSKSEKFLRTELYFGRNITGGGTVSDKEWENFLATIVTPRFPDGLTVLDATGQSSDNGKIEREASKVLVLLYPYKTRKKSRTKIEEIRTAYKKMFNQRSVLRMDIRGTVDVFF